MSEKPLKFPAFPSDPKKWPNWRRRVAENAQTSYKVSRDPEGHRQENCYLSHVIVGERWNHADTHWWSEQEQDFTKFKLEEILPNLPTITTSEKQFLLDTNQL